MKRTPQTPREKKAYRLGIANSRIEDGVCPFGCALLVPYPEVLLKDSKACPVCGTHTRILGTPGHRRITFSGEPGKQPYRL